MSTNKQEAPERIWINPGDHPADGYWYACKVVNGVEYVRADLVATARSEVWKEAMKIANTCLQEHSHLVDEYGERQNPASCIWFELEISRSRKGEINERHYRVD